MVKIHPKLRLVWGSFVAVAIATFAAILLLELDQVFRFAFSHDDLSWNILWVTPLVYLLYISAFALPVWLVVLIPLALFLPRSSALWRWPICTTCGAIAGALIVAIVFPLPGRGIASEICFPYALGAAVGAATCLTGSLIRHRFESPRKPSNQTMQPTADGPYA